jgi:hypothetical protein
VWEVIRKNCTACHGIDDYAFFALDRAGWQKLLESKHKSGGADLSEADRNLLLDWLVSKFGPETKPTFHRRSRRFFPTLKPSGCSIARVPSAMGWSASRVLAIRRSAGGCCWWI